MECFLITDLSHASSQHAFLNMIVCRHLIQPLLARNRCDTYKNSTKLFRAKALEAFCVVFACI